MLTLKDVNKHFLSTHAVADLSVNVQPGEILGLIGQNGSGKTTTFRMLLDFISPDSGEILWNGDNINKLDRSSIGYLPEERSLYSKMTVYDQVSYFAQLRGMKKSEIKIQLPKWMDLFQVKGAMTDKIKSLSKGNQQKVQLICTLIYKPKLLILDEPFSGLDPVNASLLKQGIFLLKQSGSTIIYSSHDMSNVEELSDKILMLNSGRTVLSGTVEQVRSSFGNTRIFLKSSLSEQDLKKYSSVKILDYTADTFKLSVTNPDVGKQIFSDASVTGYIQIFEQVPPSLEEIFTIKAVN